MRSLLMSVALGLLPCVRLQNLWDGIELMAALLAM